MIRTACGATSAQSSRFLLTIICAPFARCWKKCWKACRRACRGSIPALDGPSVAPERLLRALLLQALYSIRSERQLMEQLDYNLLFPRFMGRAMDDPI